MESGGQQVDIKYYISVIYKRRGLAIIFALCIMTLGIAASFTVPTTYEASSTVLVERDIINDLIRDIAATTPVQDRVKALSVVLTSRSQLIKVMSDLDMAVERMPEEQVEGMIRSLQGRTQVRMTASGSGRPAERDIFTVSFRGRDPRFARDYVNALIRRYIESNLSSSREAAYGANRFILEQLNMYKERIDRIKSELASRKNESVTALNERLAELQTRLDRMMLHYTNDHPDIIMLRSNIESARRQLKSRQGMATDSRTKKTARRQDGQLEGSPGQALKGSEAWDAASVQPTSDQDKVRIEDLTTSELEQQKDAYQIIYEDLTRKMGKAEVSAHVESQDKTTTFRIIDPAVLPTAPVGPSRLMTMLMSILGGLIGGAGLVILLDMLDGSVKDLDTLKRAGMVIVGVIPPIQDERAVLAMRRQDILLYSITGIYCIGIASVITLELLGAWK